MRGPKDARPRVGHGKATEGPSARPAASAADCEELLLPAIGPLVLQHQRGPQGKLEATMLASALVLGLRRAAWTHAYQGGHPASGIHADTQPRFATHAQELGEDLVLDLNVSLSPRTLACGGREVRPSPLRAIFET